MLCLERQHGEAIVLLLPEGQQVRVTVDLSRPGRVILGVEAPREVPIWREELLRGYREAVER